MSGNGSNSIWSRIPNWLIGLGLIAVAIVVLIQMFRGDAIMCADGSIFAKSCPSSPVLEGAVVAFDSDALNEKKCPEGWEPFKLSRGRFLVGAGPAPKETGGYHLDANEHPLTNHRYLAIGGSEKLLLSAKGLPKHEHKVVARLDNNTVFAKEWGHTVHEQITKLGLTSPITNRVSVDDGKPFQGKKGELIADGEGKQEVVFSNMPPFIALYFCKKKKENK